ncbi:MAG: sulfite exporter TauE/SafE family protein [Micavibrio sp.]
MSIIFLVPAFFVTALFYASVGFGGGSTYNALLALAGTDYRIMPVLALICNLIVVSGGTYRFTRSNNLDLRRIAPWIIASVPAAWLGGKIDIPEDVFLLVLGISLLLAGLQMLFRFSEPAEIHLHRFGKAHPVLPFSIGAGLGFLAGLVGIGGGIFLAPILYFLRWGNARMIAGTCSFFILVNSLSGLAGQIMKQSDLAFAARIGEYWMLFPAVLLGGAIGSYLGATRLDPRILRFLTAFLILYVAMRLLWRWWSMV